MPASQPSEIPDVQGSPDSRQIRIQRVGVKGLRHPVRVAEQNGEAQHTIAEFDIFVSLSPDLKGTHMSRFVEVLNDNDDALSSASLEAMASLICERLESDSAYVKMKFPFFVKKTAPVSKVVSLMDYEVTMTCKVEQGRAINVTQVLVPATSLCPCSKEISDYGAHNQRAHVTIAAEPAATLSAEELIALVEEEASSQLYGVLKRADEKFVTEEAYDNPKFCEDLARDVAARLAAHERVRTYRVEVENFESIHNHSAYAMIDGDIPLV